MPYSIQNLSFRSIEEKKYFFDANLWILILKPRIQLTARQKQYLDFFSKFTNSILNPKIIVTSLVLSEVINRYLREVSMNLYAKKNNESIVPSYYKMKYRQTDDFKIQYELLCDEIKSYHKYYELVSDEFGQTFKSKHILKSPPKGLDFNDYYYYKLAQEKGYVIVTDDSDFFVENVEIMTLNPTLLNKAKENIEIKR